jgi:hypothetical protein
MRTLKRLLALTTACASLAMASPTAAEPHSAPVKLLEVRVASFGGGSPDVAYIYVAGSSVCSNATLFEIPLGSSYGQGILAVALSALNTGNLVVLEVSNTTGCTTQYGGGPLLQSMSIVAPGAANPY